MQKHHDSFMEAQSVLMTREISLKSRCHISGVKLPLLNRIDARFFWLLIVLIGANLSASFAQPLSYALLQHKGAKQTTVRVYDRRTKRTIWKHSYPDAWGFTWSRDRRALAFVTTPNMKDDSSKHLYQFRVVTWRAGERVCLHSPRPYTGYDYVEFFMWSPDNQRLLITAGSSGEADTMAGNMWCMNFDSDVTNSIPGMMTFFDSMPRWHGHHRIVYYRRFGYLDKHENPYHINSKRPYTYFCP